MDLANCSLMEITMALVGKAYLEEFSEQVKWTILGLMNKPGSYLETDIGVKYKIYSDEDLKNFLLQKIDNLRKILSEKYPTENDIQKDVRNDVPNLENVPSTEEDPKNVISEALSVHDSSDENDESEDTEEKTKTVVNETFVVEHAELKKLKESKKMDENKENLDATFTISSRESPLPSNSKLRKSRLFDVADWKDNQNDVVESPVLSRLKQNRKRRQLQNEEDHTSSTSGACKRLRLEKLSVAEDAASFDDDADRIDKEETDIVSKIPLKTEKYSPTVRRKSNHQEEDLAATHFSELVSKGNTDRPEKQSTTVSSKKLHTIIKRAESLKVSLERVRTGDVDAEENSEELNKDVSVTLEESEKDSLQRSEETSDDRKDDSSQISEETTDDRSEEPECSPTKVILRESDLIKYTKSCEIYITPLTKEEIHKHTKKKPITIQTSSSSDSEFDEMAQQMKSRRKSPRKKGILISKESSSEDSSDDSDAENHDSIRIQRSIPKPKATIVKPKRGRKKSQLANLQIDMKI